MSSSTGKRAQRSNPGITSLISATNTFIVNYLIGPMVGPYKLSHAVALYCDRVNRHVKRLFIRTSIHGDNEMISQATKNRLFLAITHSCFYARIKKASFVLLYITIDKDRVSIVLDTDVPILYYSSSDIISRLTLDHIQKLGGKLSEDCIGLKDQTYRLSFTVGPGPEQLVVEQLVTA